MSPNGWAVTRRSNSPGHEALLCGLIAEVPDATLDELVARLRKAPVSARQGSRPAALACGGFWTVSASALKKTLHASEQDRPDVQGALLELRQGQPKLDCRHLIFVDGERSERGDHQHGPPLWPLPQRLPAGVQGASWPLADDHLHRRLAP